jgi:hypothetical protein
MEFLNKIENLINQLLIRLWEGFLHLLWKLIPTPLKSRLNWLLLKKNDIAPWLANLPKFLVAKTVSKVGNAKQELGSMNYKAALINTYKVALKSYENAQPGKKLGGLKMLFMMPFLMIGQWLQGLSVLQSLLLLTFSGASIIASIGIIFSGQRMMNVMDEASRGPASAQVDEYDRPVYYKKQTRHLEFTALRLPVYLPSVNELKSVDVDFTVTFTTREATLLMSKLEFQLRDHLILNVEPSIASFPLQEEGKQILKEKLHEEVTSFMQERKVPGEVQEVKITYILAN